MRCCSLFIAVFITTAAGQGVGSGIGSGEGGGPPPPSPPPVGAGTSLSVTFHVDSTCSSPPSPFPGPPLPFDGVSGQALTFADGGECVQTASNGYFHVYGDCRGGAVTFNWFEGRPATPSAGCPSSAIYNGGWAALGIDTSLFQNGYCFTPGGGYFFLFACGAASATPAAIAAAAAVASLPAHPQPPPPTLPPSPSPPGFCPDLPCAAERAPAGRATPVPPSPKCSAARPAPNVVALRRPRRRLPRRRRRPRSHLPCPSGGRSPRERSTAS